MRTRLKNSAEVFHIWAQQTQYEGRAANVFFRDRSIFSYGEHFEIARFVSPEIVLFTTRSSSMTTSGHISAARSAVSHKKTFTVPSFTDHNENALHLVNEVKEQIAKVKRARTSIKWNVERVGEEIAKALDYLATFKKDISKENRAAIRALDKYRAKELPQALIDAKLAKEKAYNEKESERRAAADARRAEQFRKEQLAEAERLELWKRGEYSGPLGWNVPTLLRIKGDSIQTTRGAEIPLIAARRLWRRFLKNPVAPELAGLNLGHYTVNAVEVTDNTTKPETEGALIVGCHRIPFSELYRMADALGWRNGVPFTADEITGEAMPRTASDQMPGDGFGEVQP